MIYRTSIFSSCFKIPALFFLITMAVCCFQSCATSSSPEMTAVAAHDQKAALDGTLISRKKHFVALSPYYELDDAITEIGLARDKRKFMLTVRNHGETPIVIDRDTVSVEMKFSNTDTPPQKIDIQPCDDFMADFDREYDEGEKNYIYDTIYEVWNLVQMGAMDIERATDHMRDLKYDLEAMRRQKKILEKVLPETLLSHQVIPPSKNFTGIVICDTRDLDPEAAGEFRVTVTIDNETYLFTYLNAP